MTVHAGSQEASLCQGPGGLVTLKTDRHKRQCPRLGREQTREWAASCLKL